ncbi:cytochrome P450 monooxygenase-like protein [Delitschia confertaspora ATCC 74209]|uniref:Cytochrome P450 monooxygenase-like protein n=1 Tax=Delitschia confertaspora ATCC 74209 TaxID=1513339 RepID=A0A9P4JKL3_9PLEO|nr:cytochrome P450 monooxygenase-like protein [Delitschia confertaspora ATCC 74209]
MSWIEDLKLEVPNLGISLPIQFLIVSLCAYAVSLLSMHLRGPKAPLVGLRSIFEPRYLANWMFFRNASAVLNQGYSKFTTQPWKFARADTDMLVLPPKYVEELRSLPAGVASPTVAHAFNLSGGHTNMNIILKNNLHFRTLQEKLTPNLSKLTRPMQEELNFAVDNELPECDDDWVAIKPYYTILRLVSRISARIFLGLPYCRNEEWLEISTEFTENVFVSLVVLRLFPRFLHPVISWILPSTWIGANYIRRAKRLLVPEIKRRQAEPASLKSSSSKREENLLDWMIDLGTQTETAPKDLAHLEVVMSLASIHTSQMNAVHVLYDLASLPGYIEVLREEIRQVIKEDGPWMQWDKTSFYKLKKLDSFMRESQRMNPPSLLSYHRVMLQPHVLSDGTLLPKNAHIAMPVNAIQNHPSITPNPEKFDPLRYYKLRQREGEGHLHQFATTEPNILNFGHGKWACPGRFFASLEIKNILVRLIMDYDWKLPEGEGRPKNLTAHEFIFPNQKATLHMKRRAKEDRLVI